MNVLENSMNAKIIIFIIATLCITAVIFLKNKNRSTLPIVAIANYGPHASLDEAIKGIKDGLSRQGFKDNENIKIHMSDVGFDQSLIPQMVTKLKSQNPAVMVVIGTPIAQFAKNEIKHIPIVFSVITDPVEAGLLKEVHKSDKNMTGVSDKQNIDELLNLSKKIMPNSTRVGMLYATSEANDIALVKMFKEVASQHKIEVISVPVDQARDVPFRMQLFKNKVDFIYVGASGAIQPTLPVIAAEADKMSIPIFNVNEKAVLDHQVLASFGVNYHQVGLNTGQMVGKILRGKKVVDIEPLYPTIQTHRAFISRSRIKRYDLIMPSDLSHITVVD